MPIYRFAIVCITLALSFSQASAVVTDTNIWINEFHYDNTGGDVNEFIEVIAPSGFVDLSTVAIDLYNGANGDDYGTHTLDTFTAGDTSNGFTVYSKAIAGIQNGPDGIALSVGGSVVQFLGYEGTTFTADQGVANGLTTTNIGATEGSSEAITSSLQLVGTGDSLLDYNNNWVQSDTSSVGSVNANQALRGKLFNEEFNNDAGFTKSEDFFSDGGSDYFGITDGNGTDDYGVNGTPGGENNYGGAVGTYLNGEDLDGEGASLPIVLDWTGIDISNYENLEFMDSFAEFDDGAPGNIDTADFITIDVQIDDGGFITILEFRGDDPDTFNGLFAVDTDGDGLGDGETLNGTFAEFVANIGGTGSSLDLRLSISVDSGSEDFAADNFMIIGDLIQANNGPAVPEPTTFALLGFAGLALARRRRNAA